MESSLSLKGLDIPHYKKISKDDIAMCKEAYPGKNTPILLIDMTTPLKFLAINYPVKFTVNKKTYFCIKQYILSEKAKLFNDQAAHQEIMKRTSIHELKNINIKNFDKEVYNNRKFDIYLKAYYYRLKASFEDFEEFMRTGQNYIMEKKYWHKKLKIEDNIVGKVLILLRYVCQKRLFDGLQNSYQNKISKLNPQSEVYTVDEENHLKDSDLIVEPEPEPEPEPEDEIEEDFVLIEETEEEKKESTALFRKAMVK